VKFVIHLAKMLDEIQEQLKTADPFKSWWPFIIAGAVFLVSTIKSYMSGQYCPNGNLISDYVVLITGADGGIGTQIVKELSKRGGHIIMCCKKLENGEQVKKKIMKSLKKVRIDIRQLDLRSFDDIHRLVKSIGKNPFFIVISRSFEFEKKFNTASADIKSPSHNFMENFHTLRKMMQ
jgi:3-oxoacyl-ACP reductase-like protein